MADDRYDKTTHDGRTVDKFTKAALVEAERRLGYPLSIVQGSYNSGVGASAGTHDGGGAVDLLAWDYQKKVRVLRDVGFAAWYRPTIPGLWGAHIHAILLGNERASSGAKSQMTSYRAGRDGLKYNRVDPNPYRPDPIPIFRYNAPAPKPKPKRPRTFFVDVHPNYQRGFNFAKAKSEGIAAAVIKCTEGASVEYDNYWPMVQDARKAGLGVGVYHWLRHDSPSPKAQAEHLARNIRDKSLPVFVDVERGTGGDSPTKPDLANFVREARELGLNVVGAYLPRWYHEGHMSGALLTGMNLTLWNSAYGINAALSPKAALAANVSTGRWAEYGGVRPRFLQFGSRVKVAGMNVDCNVFRGSKAELLAGWFNTAEPEQPKPDPEPTPDPEPKPSKPFTATLITYNMGGKATFDDLARLVALARSKTRGRFVIALQETGDQDANLVRAVAELGVQVLRGPKGQGRSKVALLVPVRASATFDLVKLTPRTRVGPEGAGGAMTDHKYLLTADVTFAGGASLEVGCFHFMSSVQGPDTPWRNKRVGLWKTQAAGTRDWLKGAPNRVALGDSNAVIGSELMKTFTAAGLSIHGKGSHGGSGKNRRPIDVLIHDPAIDSKTADALAGYGSDHRPVVFDVEVPR